MKRAKRYNLVKRNIAVGMLLAMLNSMLFADIKVDKNIPQNTSVDRAPNGANIININTPNSKGISVRGSTCEGTTRGKLKKIRQYP